MCQGQNQISTPTAVQVIEHAQTLDSVWKCCQTSEYPARTSSELKSHAGMHMKGTIVVRNLQTFSMHIRTTLVKYTSAYLSLFLWRYFWEASSYLRYLKLRYNFRHVSNSIGISLILSLVITVRVRYLKVTPSHVTSLHFPRSVPSFDTFRPTPFPFSLITFLFFYPILSKLVLLDSLVSCASFCI